MNSYNILEQVRQLSEESQAGMLFCLKALKTYEYDYQKALSYLKSDKFKSSIETKPRR